VLHQAALEKLFVEVIGVLSAEGFVKLQRVMQDGTKIRANAADDSFRRRETLAEHLEQARVKRLEAAVAQIQQLEASSGEEARVSSSDPEARRMKQPDGGFAPSYNVQTTTAAVGKAIVSLNVTQAGNDFKQLTPAIDRVQRTLESKPEQAVVDGGYISQENILDTHTNGVEWIGPAMNKDAKAAQGYARTGVKPEFYADRFGFDAAENCYYCPQGMRLNYQGKTKSELVVIHKYQARAADCAGCACKTDCCPKNEKTGRSVQRSEYQQEINDFQQRMATPERQEIYRQRSEVAETPHLWMKAKFGLRQFHVRGLVKAGQEALWAALTSNIVLLVRNRRQVSHA